ncbi:MarR family transcriptional regulator [Tateyamaria sp. ANG-S1]|uniref:MarR family winged helix-turn-helix transcriptional regulator n=1 Tax=Tateyamaria sp. ANG-S1 TaxID=1577905 RepID=UPI00057DBE20|nr:MarR family transcriptional regulator [Tateyamaria sp. ANG-S1]KIC51927.1 MarR family transcriptional regulator [Tateyamaria sp. ANG-S1]
MVKTDDFDVRQFLPYLLNQAAEASSLEFQKVYKDKYGMLRNEWRVLFHLGIYGQMTASDIGARAQMHKTKISRAVQRLAERRYLIRTRAEVDRRVEYLTLTSAGQRVYQDLKATAAEYDAALIEGMSVQEAAMLRALLERLALRK